MTKAVKYEDQVGKTWEHSSIQLFDGSTRGYVITKYGIVLVYAESISGLNMTSLVMVHAGHTYTRWYDRCLSNRGAVAKARKFIREVMEGGEA